MRSDYFNLGYTTILFQSKKLLGAMQDDIRAGPSYSPTEEEEDLTIFENKSGLAEDLKFLASMPELCDVTFLVGETREPVCGVRAVLASRSKVFQQMLYSQVHSPQKKRDTAPKEIKPLQFLKRSSEPKISLQTAKSAPSVDTSAGGTLPRIIPHQTLIIEEFEPDVFRQLIEYVHTGSVTLQPRTLLGVMNASDQYGVEELRKACQGFISCCINVDTVCALLQSADKYVHYKGTKTFLKQVLAFVDERGNEVLNLGSFALLPLHVVRLILSRKQLVADEFTKFQAALMWTMKYSDLHKEVDWKTLFRENFLNSIQYHKIPANVLMKEVDPLNVVPGEIVMAALAYQADPNIDMENNLPNPLGPGAPPPVAPFMPGIDFPYASTTTLNSMASSEHTSSEGNKH